MSAFLGHGLTCAFPSAQALAEARLEDSGLSPEAVLKKCFVRSENIYNEKVNGNWYCQYYAAHASDPDRHGGVVGHGGDAGEGPGDR